MPDASDRFLQGGIPGIYHEAGLPNLSYRFRNAGGSGEYGKKQILTDSGAGGETIILESGEIITTPINIVGTSDTVQPKSLEMIFCVRY